MFLNILGTHTSHPHNPEPPWQTHDALEGNEPD
ncbi:MAG: hypothetical protein QOD05_1351 [Microbacteriaceae bacterium]|jgi:hypothetical protein|nr:hypothetical protein [Leifsonia sp.]MDQ1580576.1 hypothetical protein [Microbacteriaceae bacterium]MDQ1587192.1 hypothetical protein [Microbacteriaceae bacterium]MDQ1607797.1 hypothetical protein [Microbacteriaceae bacterium]